MTTHVERARARVKREREAVGTKRGAYDRFRSRVESIPSQVARPKGGTTLVSSSGGTAARPIREAFSETIAPTCEERPVTELLAAELSEEIATALATGGPSATLCRAVRSEIEQRRAELAAMDRALDAEAESLARTIETIEPIREWLIEENETPLSARGFEELRACHERLAAYRADCDALVADRQDQLGRTTGAGGRAGLRHRDLQHYLYEGAPIDHPVLVTATRLDGLCAECQRTVRGHLVRRV